MHGRQILLAAFTLCVHLGVGQAFAQTGQTELTGLDCSVSYAVLAKAREDARPTLLDRAGTALDYHLAQSPEGTDPDALAARVNADVSIMTIELISGELPARVVMQKVYDCDQWFGHAWLF